MVEVREEQRRPILLMVVFRRLRVRQDAPLRDLRGIGVRGTSPFASCPQGVSARPPIALDDPAMKYSKEKLGNFGEM